MPFFNARELAACIVGPSAIGSENGIPNSIAPAPFSINVLIIFLLN
jgi:hypothetical protein